MRMTWVWAGVLVLTSGCVVRLGPGPVGPVASRGPMGQAEAVSAGHQLCASRGYSCQLHEARLTGQRVWKLEYRVAAAGARGKYKVELDAYSRQVLKERDKLKGEKHGHGRHDDDD